MHFFFVIVTSQQSTTRVVIAVVGCVMCFEIRIVLVNKDHRSVCEVCPLLFYQFFILSVYLITIILPFSLIFIQ